MIRHLACVMDGNRRWARSRNWLPWLGHKEGVAAMQRTAQFCLEQHIPILSLYTFSTENFNRPKQELDYFFDVLPHEIQKTVIDDCCTKGIQVRFIGDRALFPTSVRSLCDEIEQRTVHGKNLLLNLLFCYGGQQEILHGIKQLIADVQAGLIKQAELSIEVFERYLWTGHLPAPDLIIRTGGVQRLSNFFLFKAAYSELYFTDCLWPEISVDDLHKAVSFYQKAQRNFGT